MHFFSANIRKNCIFIVQNEYLLVTCALTNSLLSDHKPAALTLVACFVRRLCTQKFAKANASLQKLTFVIPLWHFGLIY